MFVNCRGPGNCRWSTTESSSRLTSSAMNWWCGVETAARRRATASEISSAFGYRVWEMMRMQPFWVRGQDTQPDSMWPPNYSEADA